MLSAEMAGAEFPRRSVSRPHRPRGVATGGRAEGVVVALKQNRDSKTAGSRLALVADDRQLARSIQEHLERHLGEPAFHCAFEAIREYLARDTDGLLLAAAGSPANCKAVCWLVQDVCLQKLPPSSSSRATPTPARSSPRSNPTS